MKILLLLLAALPLFAQSNAIQLCDQQSTRHCLTLKVPAALAFNPTPVTLSGNSGALLVGLASTDLGLLPGAIVSADAFVSASATTNASVISMAATPFSSAGPGADISVSKTGTGTLLPLRFFRNPNEVARFDTSNRLLLGLTSSDVATSGLGAIITGNSIVSATATANASVGSFAAIAGSYVALASSRTGSGAFLPMTFFTNATERMRILTTGEALFGRTTDNGLGTLLQVEGGVSSVQNSRTQVGNAFVSSGGSDLAHFASNAWFNGSVWVIPNAGRTSAIIQFSDNVINFARTTTPGGAGFLYTMAITAAGNVNVLNGLTVGSGCTGCGVTSVGTAGPITGGTITTSGTIDCPTCLTTAGGQTISSVDTFSSGIKLGGGAPQIDATALGNALNINGSSSTNGNIVINPGNVAGLAALVVNGHNNGATTTQTLTLNEVSGGGGGITMRHGGTFDAAWQGGSGAAFDVVSNDAVTHRMVILQTGPVLIARTSDNGTGALLQVQGGVSFVGGLTANGSSGVTGTINVRNSAGVASCSITFSAGVVVATTC